MQSLYPALPKPFPYVYQPHQPQQPPKRSFHLKPHIYLSRNLYTKLVYHQTSRNQSSHKHKRRLQISTRRNSSCLTKSTKMTTNLAARVTTSTSKSQSSMISVDELVCHQMPTFTALPSCYLVRLKRTIMQIAIPPPLNNFVLTCSHSLKALGGNVLTSLNGRPLASPILSQQILLYRQPNAFVNSVPSLILYNEA